MKFMFDSHGGDSKLNARTGQLAEVLRALTTQEADINDVGPMFRIRFEDGFETDAFADELTLYDLGLGMVVVDEVAPFTEEQWRELRSRWGFDAKDAPKWFAVTRWAAKDVIAVAEERGVTMTAEQAEVWWSRNESWFENLPVERGNEILSEMDFSA